MSARALLAVTLVAVACGGCRTGCGDDPARAGGSNSAQVQPGREERPADAQQAPPVAPPEISELPVGGSAHAAFAWAGRAGQAAYEAAREAEARQDWAAMVSAARGALAADPAHLEAAWLLSLGLARLGEHAAVVAPLHAAVAGDFGRWGEESLVHPALTAFLASAPGAAWREHVERDRAAYLDALARATIVLAGGDLYAVDVDASRWLPLTRTGGAVIGALRPTRDRLAYVVRDTASSTPVLALGTIELAHGRTTSPVSIATPGPVTLAYSTRSPVGFWLGSSVPKARWRHRKDDGTLARLPAKTRAPAGPRLEIDPRSLQLRSLPIEKISADWDEHGLASAIRLGSSNRVVSAPGAALIAGHTIAWSPSRAHLAFVAQPDAPCAPGAISALAYVANAATGTVTEVGRATGGLAISWIGERRLALAGDDGVTIVELDGGPTRLLAGATDLLVPRTGRACADEETPDEKSDVPVVEPP